MSTEDSMSTGDSEVDPDENGVGPDDSEVDPDDSDASPFSSLSTAAETELSQPLITPLGFNASATFHRVSLTAAPSGFRTMRRAA